MTEPRRKALLAGLAIGVLSVCVTAAPQARWTGTMVKDGGVTLVKNPNEPLNTTPILELAEEISFGGPEAEGDAYLGLPWAIAVDDAGRFIGRIPLQGTGIEIVKGKYYAVEEDEAGGQHVKRYGVTWRTK